MKMLLDILSVFILLIGFIIGIISSIHTLFKNKASLMIIVGGVISFIVWAPILVAFFSLVSLLFSNGEKAMHITPYSNLNIILTANTFANYVLADG